MMIYNSLGILTKCKCQCQVQSFNTKKWVKFSHNSFRKKISMLTPMVKYVRVCKCSARSELEGLGPTVTLSANQVFKF